MGLSLSHLLLFGAIIYLVFGTKKVPELGRSISDAVKGFKKGLAGDDQRDVTPPEKLAQDSTEKT